MGKSTEGTKLSSFPILLGTSSFLLFKESTVQEGEVGTQVLLIFTQTGHAFADASGILLEQATGAARYTATTAEVAHKQEVTSSGSGHMQLLGKHSTGMKGTWMFRCA